MSSLDAFLIGSTQFFGGQVGYSINDLEFVRFVPYSKASTFIGDVENHQIPGTDIYARVTTIRWSPIIPLINDIKKCVAEENKLAVLFLKLFLSYNFKVFMQLNTNTLKRVNFLTEYIKTKDKYLVYIYSCFIDNGDYFLTDEQTELAFKKYQAANKTNENSTCFLTGSATWFANRAETITNDVDLIVWIKNNANTFDWTRLTLDVLPIDIFVWTLEDKTAIKEVLSKTTNPTAAAAVLQKQFAHAFNLTIDDIKELENHFETLDNKHRYLINIYKSYIENNSFELTKKQKDYIYAEYKSNRNPYLTEMYLQYQQWLIDYSKR